MTQIANPQIELAHKYIRYTNKNIFLTGKAGTGKTTFLQNIKKEEFKRMAIVAPTGVAAINAGGMTIHSFFQLPFGPMTPEKIKEEVRKKRFNSKKIKLIKSLDLLVIDEISMVRADVLDAIDGVLRRYRDFTQAFGGVQLLMVGDLHQLPPVVRNEEWSLLSPHYQTMYFFGSLALQKTNPITIELKHIYRQADHQFIDLLNKVRNNKLDAEVLATLNSRYQPDFKAKEDDGYITLTSHNAVAQKINVEKLSSLSGKSYQFRAEIRDNFPEKSFPTEEVLSFKLGAQVMFVKNDLSPEKLYYNGKIGQIVSIDKEVIKVQCKGDPFNITVTPSEWYNVKYKLDEKSKEVTEEVAGSFTQIPLKLAWAITIHKSQGLTFERAIIDAEAAFAHGQVYVALSRCTSFEGIVLRSKIGNSSVRTDQVVERYSKEADQNAPDENHLEQSKQQYQQSLLLDLFNFKMAKDYLAQFQRVLLENERSIEGDAAVQLQTLIEKSQSAVFAIAEKFSRQLPYYFQQDGLPEVNEDLQERVKKASDYFSNQFKSELIPALQKVKILSDNQAIKKLAAEKQELLTKEFFTKHHCFLACLSGFKTHLYIRSKANADLNFQKAKRSAPKEKKEVLTIAHPILNDRLIKWRKEKGAELDVPLYRILTTKSLIGILNSLPANIQVLKIINGLGPKKIKEFGEEIIQMVNDYCIEMDIDAELRNQFSEAEIAKIVPKKAKIDTKLETFNLYKAGKDVATIAKERGLVKSTIEGHLAHYIGLGELDITPFVSIEKVNKIDAFFKAGADRTFGQAKAHMGDAVSFGEIRMAMAFLKRN